MTVNSMKWYSRWQDLNSARSSESHSTLDWFFVVMTLFAGLTIQQLQSALLSLEEKGSTKAKGKGKGKAVPLQARCGPEGSRRSRLPDFHDIRHVKVVRSSASSTGRLYPQECSWYSFALGAESTPGPWCGGKEVCHWKIQWHHWELILGLSD
jgi:hypothetical protein